MNLKKRMLQAIKNKIWKMRGGPARLAALEAWHEKELIGGIHVTEISLVLAKGMHYK